MKNDHVDFFSSDDAATNRIVAATTRNGNRLNELILRVSIAQHTNIMRVISHMPTRKKKKSSKVLPSSSPAAAASSTNSNNNLRLEKMVIASLLMIAWGWIMVTMGMVFYHGYYNRIVSRSFPHQTHDQWLQQAHSFPGQEQEDASATAAGDGQRREQNAQQAPNAQIKASFSTKTTTTIIHPYESPLLIFTCHREEYLNTTLADIFRYIPRDNCRMGCPIIISQDGNYEPVAQVIRFYQEKFQRELNIPVIHWQHHASSLRGAGVASGAAAYKALAVHYGWALQKVFDNKTVVSIGGSTGGGSNTAATTTHLTVQPKRVLILEEDLHVACDFFDYFAALAPLLDRDATLLAISAYNDNGYAHAVGVDVQQGSSNNNNNSNSAAARSRVLRSDFFPGLGWMMTRKLWTNELQAKWPDAYWDDWLREPAQRQGRHVLRPEVSRTFHFGVSGGASNNQFGQQLSQVVLNPTPVTWSNQDLSYLNLDRFDRSYWQMLHSSRRVTSLVEARQLILQQQQQHAGATSSRRPAPELVLRLEYNNLQEFAKFAKSLGLSTDEKAGVPRTAYKGVVETRFDSGNRSSSNNNNHILLLTPPMQELQKEFEDVI
jgi:alpha-1,3-mannosyl-glycoprotein beta-1,2-N-acetylglucosaminyltransferase